MPGWWKLRHYAWGGLGTGERERDAITKV
eukprot:SAG11_NODE_14364_length_614_cov_12.407767_1_plen_28_part_10